ncbi:MAG: hypothetical protein AAGI25_15425 [Bacteroidota bacterium]
MSKNTVKSYLTKLEGLLSTKNGNGLSINELIGLEDPVLEWKLGFIQEPQPTKLIVMII